MDHLLSSQWLIILFFLGDWLYSIHLLHHELGIEMGGYPTKPPLTVLFTMVIFRDRDVRNYQRVWLLIDCNGLTHWIRIDRWFTRNSNVPNRTGQTELVKNHWLSPGNQGLSWDCKQLLVQLVAAITKNPGDPGFLLREKDQAFDIRNCWLSNVVTYPDVYIWYPNCWLSIWYHISRVIKSPHASGIQCLQAHGEARAGAGKSTWRPWWKTLVIFPGKTSENVGKSP